MSLGDLIAAAGTSTGALAVQIGVDSTFLDRVVAQRQPLPIDVAKLIAKALGTDVGTVQGAAGLVTQQTGPIYRRAVPPDLLRGDVVSAPQLGRTVPVMAQPRSSISVLVAGAGIAGPGAADGIVSIDRSIGPTGFTAFAHITLPFEMAFGPGGLVYTAGSPAFAASLAVVQQAPKLVAEVASANTVSSTGVCYEETTNTVWVASDMTHGLVRIASLTPLVSTSFPLTLSGVAATPFCVVAHGGFVYVTVKPTGTGGVLKIDPNTGATVQEFHGLGTPFGIAVDEETGVLLVTTTDGVWSIRFAPSFEEVPGDALVGASWVSHFDGSFWVSSVGVTPTGPRITRLTVSPGDPATVLADFTLGPDELTGTAGHVLNDVDGFIWATCPDQGQVRILDPTMTSGDPTVQIFDLGGHPQGLLIL